MSRVKDAEWHAVKGHPDRRRVQYWRLTTDNERRKGSLGAVAPQSDGTFRARTYDWEAGNPGGEVLGFFPTKRNAMRAVEDAALMAHLRRTVRAK